MKEEFRSRVYTDRPDYADFEPAAKFNAIQSIIAKRLREHPNAICSYSGGSDSDIMIDLIERTRKIFNLSSVKYAFFNTGDLDHDVVNLFRCIQEDADRLAAMVMTTPFSREKYEDTYKLDVWELMMPDEPYHKALRFLIRCWQGHGFRTNGSKVGWKNDVQGRERAYALWNWYRLPEWIVEIAERLRMVQIENRPALEVIERFNYSNVFMYIDPPYVLGTRTGKQYKHEMSDADHEELLKLLLQSRAKIMLSGYESGLYNNYLIGWEKKQFFSCAEHGKPRIETVWMNYKADLQMNFWDFPEVMP